MPIRMCSTFKVFTCFRYRFFKILDAVKNGFFLGVLLHLVALLEAFG